MSIVALIPARSGSKRLPGKNIMNLAGTPLIGWTIRSAIESRAFQRVVVSTDDESIAQIAMGFGAEVPWLRPNHLATDEATSIAVAQDALSRLSAEQCFPDALMLLQPTSPFRSCESIVEAVNLFRRFGESVVSVSPARTHPYWCKRIRPDGVLQPFRDDYPDHIGTDLPSAYELNGVIYLASVDQLMRCDSFYSNATRALLIHDQEEALDIDTPMDWSVAEVIASKRPCAT